MRHGKFSKLRSQRECGADGADSSNVAMWILKVSELLNLNDMPNHEQLLKEGMLVERRNLQQLRVLQKALQNIITGRTKVVSEAHSQFHGDKRELSKVERKKIQDGYLWWDWFCVPQEAIETIETREASKLPKSSKSSDTLEGLTSQELFVRSIPFFVAECDVFVALVPKACHYDTKLLCNFKTY